MSEVLVSDSCATPLFSVAKGGQNCCNQGEINQLLATLLEMVTPAIVIKDTHTLKCLAVNQIAATLFGGDRSDRADLVGQKTIDWLPVEQAEILNEYDRTALGQNKAVAFTQLVTPQATGLSQLLNCTTIPICNDSGTPVYLLTTCTITSSSANILPEQVLPEQVLPEYILPEYLAAEESQPLDRQLSPEVQLKHATIELEHLREQLNRLQVQMLQSEKMASLGQLVAGIAHEINNPVNFIYGNLKYTSEYAQDLLRVIQHYRASYPNPTPELAAFMEEVDLAYLMEDLPQILSSMKVGADRIREIVLSLRNFSRLDDTELQEIDLHQGLDNTLVILQNRLKSKSDRPEILVTKHYGVLPSVQCYAGQLNQVFMNILSNAIDALEDAYDHGKCPQPAIQLHTELVNDRAIIQFSDNGLGIPEHIQAHLFDPFFTTKPVGQGTGLGLSISYQIVTEKHQGTLDCISTLGQGTTFRITIPLELALNPHSSTPINDCPQ